MPNNDTTISKGRVSSIESYDTSRRSPNITIPGRNTKKSEKNVFKRLAASSKSVTKSKGSASRSKNSAIGSPSPNRASSNKYGSPDRSSSIGMADNNTLKEQTMQNSLGDYGSDENEINPYQAEYLQTMTAPLNLPLVTNQKAFQESQPAKKKKFTDKRPIKSKMNSGWGILSTQLSSTKRTNARSRKSPPIHLSEKRYPQPIYKYDSEFLRKNNQETQKT